MAPALLLLISLVVLAGLFPDLAVSRFIHRPPYTNTTTVQSTRFPGISVSFKNPGICEQTPGVKEYAGYVHIPPNTLDVKQEYPINTFFWCEYSAGLQGSIEAQGLRGDSFRGTPGTRSLTNYRLDEWRSRLVKLVCFASPL